MTYDYNTAGEQRSFDVIPDGTIAVVQMNIRPGGAGENGLLKRSKNGDCEGLDVEHIVVEGDYAKRKVWSFMVVSGTTNGHAQAADITARKLRAILESARGITISKRHRRKVCRPLAGRSGAILQQVAVA
jgi:hypothetical protein